jgi:peptidoglycan DL-endopeptidase CwlO
VTQSKPGRHRFDGPAATPLTGSLTVVADRFEAFRRGSVVVAVSGGLVATMTVPGTGPINLASAELASSVDDVQSTVTPAVTGVIGDLFSATRSGSTGAAGENLTGRPAGASTQAGGQVGGQPAANDPAAAAAATNPALALPAGVLDDAPIQAPATASVHFDHTAWTAVPAATAAAASPAAASQVRLPQGRRVARATEAAASHAPQAPVTTQAPVTAAGPVTPQGAAKATASTTAAGASRAVAIGMRYLGVPYRWGGTIPSGFDCSGFTQYVYRQLGRTIGRTVADQRGDVTIVPRSQAKPGDLVFFGTSHVAIYLGGNQMLAAPHTGKTVQVQDIYSTNVSFGRV